MIPDSYFERFSTPKYRMRSAPQRFLIRRFASAFHEMFLEACPVASVLEVGVGEGFLSGYLSEKFPSTRFTGVDLRDEDLHRLRAIFPRIEARRCSAYDLHTLGERFDLVICAEVLEHLDEPERALDQIVSLGPRAAIFTVPHEPFFLLSNLARGKNVTRLGNDPEHVNHWGVRSFERLLATRFRVERTTTSYPWILARVTPLDAPRR